MAKSDYQILGLNDFASQDEIKKAYKKLALKYHPDKNNEAGAEDRFKEITSAYQSLINNNKNKNVSFEEMYDTSFSAEYFRRAYQKFSPQGDSFNFSRSNAYEESTSSDSISECSSDDLINEYLKQRNVFENFCDIADSVFENNNPFYETSNKKDEFKESESLSSDDTEKSDEEKSGNVPEISKDFTLNRKHDKVECNLYLSLEELVKGGLKRIAIPNRNKKKKIIKINLKPGNPVGAKIIFPKVCLGKGEPPKDFVIVVCDKPHPHFVRDGSNIHYEANISLKTALCCLKIPIPTLDGEDFMYSPTDIIQPCSQQQFAGKGLPLTVDGKERGNMVVSFKVDFPKKLSMASRKILKVALP